VRLRALLLVLICATGTAFAAKKVISPVTNASNEQVDIVATIIMDPDEVKQKLGADPGKGIVILAVKMIPKTDQGVQVSPDDFILLAHDDGERSKPFAPEELAGSGAMIITRTEAKAKKTGSTFGMGGIMMGGGGGGNGNASPGNPIPKTTTTRMDEKNKGDDALLQALRAKQMPTKTSTDEVSGYLYFPLDGKHKLKNLAVLYRGPAGKLNLEFQH
jgi:hypothetical protein